jgi:hypothetical protein
MPYTKSIAEMITLVRQRANQERSLFCTDTEITGYLQSGIKELQDLINQASGSHYTNKKWTFTTTATDLYDLPTDFLEMRGLEAQWTSGYPGFWIPVHRYNYNERNMHRNFFLPMSGNKWFLWYDLEGTQLRLVPPPQGGIVLRCDYVTLVTDLCAQAALDCTNAGLGDTVTINSNIYEIVNCGGAVTTVGNIPVNRNLIPPTGLALQGGGSGDLLDNTCSYRVSAYYTTGETLACTRVPITLSSPGGNTGAVALTWAAVPGAQGYRVYGRTNPEHLMATTSNTYWVDSTYAFTPGVVCPTADTSAVVTLLSSNLARAITTYSTEVIPGWVIGTSYTSIALTQKTPAPVLWSSTNGFGLNPSGPCWSTRAEDYQGWLDYAIMHAVISCKNKEDQDVSLEMTRLQQMEDRIRRATWARNVGEFNHIADNNQNGGGSGWWGNGGGR